MLARSLSLAVLCALFAGAAGAQPAAVDSVLAARNERGVALARQGHLDDALRQFTLLMARHPGFGAATNNCANVYVLLEEPDKAEALYRRLIEEGNEDGGVHLNLGLLLHRQGDARAASPHINRGLQLAGDVGRAYALLGLAGNGGISRAADAQGLGDLAIEDLLEQASRDMRLPASRAVAASDSAAAGSMATHPGGARAQQVGERGPRLYWMLPPVAEP